MRNWKIRTKLMFSFVIVIVFSILIGLTGIIGMKQISNGNDVLYESNCKGLYYIGESAMYYQQLRSSMRSAALNASVGEQERVVKAKADADAGYERLMSSLDGYEKTIDYSDTEEVAAYTEFRDLMTGDYRNLVMDVLDKAVNRDIDGVMERINSTENAGYIERLDGIVGKLMTLNDSDAKDNSEKYTALASSLTLTEILLLILGIILALGFAIIITNNIVKRLLEVVRSADQLAEGNFDYNTTNNDSRDETGQLSRSFGEVVGTLRTWADALNHMSVEQVAGDLDAYIDTDKFKGGYKELAAGTNEMVNLHAMAVQETIVALDNISDGDFNIAIKQYPGKKIILTECLTRVKNNLNGVSADMNLLIKSASEGKLDTRADAAKFKGGWAGMINGLNNLMESVAGPIKAIGNILMEMSKGNMQSRAKGDFKGEFKVIQDAANFTAAELSTYISEISDVLAKLADDNYDVDITREFMGDFGAIKDSLKTIVEKLNTVMVEISMASEQVTSGAKQISESSMVLAEGASVQASTVEELTASITTINEQTQMNAENAKAADALSGKTKENARNGSDEMSRMLTAMQGIKEASDNISKIIKVIDDIALQTNLLALNAAVEAARAGSAGKGFGVVAAEVRTLAVRSQAAAKQTSEMIEDTISRIGEGTQIANLTSAALNEIVGNVSDVSALISSIADASVSQAESISQTTLGLGQISDVVQKNSATSEESAAAAEELSSQSEMLNNMMSVFKLKRAYSGR